MQKKGKDRRLVIMVMVLSMMVLPSLTYGSNKVHSTIRVGLRGNYSNVSSLPVSNTSLQVGYGESDRFIPELRLESQTGFVIKPSNHQYYVSRDVYSTYGDAVDALGYYIGAEAVVAYMAPSTWRIYAKNESDYMNIVVNSGHELLVEDGRGKALLVCPNAGLAPAFAGESSQQSFNVTDLPKASYRGWFEFVRQGNTMIPVNIVDYEDYLYGVIPAEMPASWDMEALKAQAVAARSMSIYQYNRNIKKGYNVCDTTFTQVYRGFSGEHARTNQAVDETRGMVATYNGKVAETLYYSTSGGYTEDPQYVWGNLVPYLKAIADPYETKPEMKAWTRKITLADLDLCLQRQNINIGQARGLRINEYTPAGRVNELEIVGTTGSHKIVRENIRTFFTYTREGSLRSRMFTIDNSVSPDPSLPSQLDGSVAVYGGVKAPQYLVGANGKVNKIGDTLIVKGSSGKTAYGLAGNKDTNQSVQEQYGDMLISGRGFGHGVGMSQSGARGMAEEGYRFDEILKYYYQGISIE